MVAQVQPSTGAVGNQAKIIDQMSPLLQRVLIVDSSPASARMLRDATRAFTNGKISCVETPEKAFEFSKEFIPQIFIIDLGSDTGAALQLVRRVRRSYMACRHAPIIAVTSSPTADVIFAARDAGVHEFLVRPFTAIDLSRRLQAVTLRSRDWIEGMRYVGPDRRRFNSATFTGPKKRLGDGRMPDLGRLQQALKIIEFAIAFKEHDPAQALRSLRAQADALLDLSVKLDDSRMLRETQVYMRYVTCMTEFDLAKTEDLLDVVCPLLNRMADSKPGAVDFDPEVDEAERERLKAWRNHVPSDVGRLMPI